VLLLGAARCGQRGVGSEVLCAGDGMSRDGVSTCGQRGLVLEKIK
jgi:hypothetical protein